MTGGLLGVTVLVYIQDSVGYRIGYGVCLASVAVGLCVFAAGFPLYRYKRPFGSPLTRIVQVVIAASRNARRSLSAEDRLYEINNEEAAKLGVRKIDHTNKLRFLDRAAVLEDESTPSSNWRVCTVTQVEETKAIFQLMPIWAGTIVMNVVLAQLQTFTVEQGSTMQRNIGGFRFPAASIPVFPLIMMSILVPLYDKAFVPFARQFTRHERGITILQRIGVGLVLSIVSMIIAALVEERRISTAAAHGLLDSNSEASTIPMSIFWLVPQYFTFGIADMFTYIGVIEFFYDQAPVTMRSFSTGLSFCTISLGYFISTIMVNLVNKVTSNKSHPGWLSDSVPFNRKKIDYFYWLMAVLSSVNLIYFLFVANSYKYSKNEVAPQKAPDDRLDH